jgi:hypothetical protein
MDHSHTSGSLEPAEENPSENGNKPSENAADVEGQEEEGEQQHPQSRNLFDLTGLPDDETVTIY